MLPVADDASERPFGTRVHSGFMDFSLHAFITTVETSTFVFPAPHSSLVHDGAKHIRNINLRINEFLMGFGRAKPGQKSRPVIKFTGQEK